MFPTHMIAVYFCADDGWQKVAIVARIYDVLLCLEFILDAFARKSCELRTVGLTCLSARM